VVADARDAAYVTKVPAGHYWLVHRASPDYHLREAHYGDNAASLLVRIAWPDGHGSPPAVSVLRTCSREPCQL
jgi:hypothetical protein